MGIVHFCFWIEEYCPPWVSSLAAFSHVRNRQTDMDTHTHTHTQVATLLRSVHPVVQTMSRCLNRIFKGLMPIEEFSFWSKKKKVFVTTRKNKIKTATRIRGAAIEPLQLFCCKLIIVPGGEKRQPYYSPVHNRNS